MVAVPKTSAEAEDETDKAARMTTDQMLTFIRLFLLHSLAP